MKQRVTTLISMVIVMGISTIMAQPSLPGEPQSGKFAEIPPFRAPGGMHNSAENPPPMMMNIAELQNLLNEISIDKSVAAKIVAIARNFLSNFESRILKIQKEELNVKEELLKEKPDLQLIQNTIAKKTQIFAEIEFAQIKRDLEIKALLTQDEYDRWKSAMMQKMRMFMPKAMDRVEQNRADKRLPPQK
jgi:hypothetical protein